MGQRWKISSPLFFYTAGFGTDCFNYIAMLAEVFFAHQIFRATELELGLLGASGAIGYTLSCYWTGLLSERAGRRRLCMMAVLGMALVYAITPRVNSIATLCLVSFLRSVAVSFYWPPLIAWMGETCHQNRGVLSGLLGGFNIAWTIGALTGYLICGWTFQYLGPAIPFYTASILALGLFIFLSLTEPLYYHGKKQVLEKETEVTKGKFLREGLVLNFSGYFLAALVLYLFPKVVEDRVGAAAQSYLHVCRMGGQLLAFIILAKTTGWHYRDWLKGGWILFGITGVFFIWVTQSYPLYVLGFTLLGICGGIGYMMSIYYSQAVMKKKGKGSGIQESLIGAGYLFGPFYGGIVATLSSPRTSIIMGLIPVALIVGMLSRKKKS